MIAPLIQISVKLAINVAKVSAAMASKTSRALLAAGAYGKSVMQAGMRYSKSVSPPGGFPFSHTGRLRDLIVAIPKVGRIAGRYAVYAVAITPLDDLFFIGLEGAFGEGKKSIPKLINEGGVLTVRNFSPKFLSRRFSPTTDWTQKITRFTTGMSKGATTQYVYRPRPFIALTMPKANAKLMSNMETIELK